jgi:dihydroneopterin aldolase
MQQKVTIELENMKFYAYHGHYEIEQTVGNHFLVNLSVETDAFAATQSDRLKDAIDYQRLYACGKGRNGNSVAPLRTCSQSDSFQN